MRFPRGSPQAVRTRRSRVLRNGEVGWPSPAADPSGFLDLAVTRVVSPRPTPVLKDRRRAHPTGERACRSSTRDRKGLVFQVFLASGKGAFSEVGDKLSTFHSDVENSRDHIVWCVPGSAPRWSEVSPDPLHGGGVDMWMELWRSDRADHRRNVPPTPGASRKKVPDACGDQRGAPGECHRCSEGTDPGPWPRTSDPLGRGRAAGLPWSLQDRRQPEEVTHEGYRDAQGT